jgi:hypothetical protein
MEDKNMFSQNDIDKLGMDDTISMADDIKNIIILLKNELSEMEKSIDSYPRRTKKKIRTRLNNALKKLIAVRTA